MNIFWKLLGVLSHAYQLLCAAQRLSLLEQRLPLFVPVKLVMDGEEANDPIEHESRSTKSENAKNRSRGPLAPYSLHVPCLV